jgi:hypothetical protein
MVWPRFVRGANQQTTRDLILFKPLQFMKSVIKMDATHGIAPNYEKRRGLGREETA